MKFKAQYFIIFILLLLCGCGNKVQIIDVGGLPIKGAKVTPLSLSAGGTPVFTDSSGFATLSSASFSVQEIKWIQVDCIGYTMVQVPVPAKYPIVIILRKP
jgi:hypothetical protein